MQLYGEPSTPLSFLLTELPATGALLVFLPLLARVRSNKGAMLIVYAVLILSSASLPVLSSLRSRGLISGGAWFSLVGAATYLAYVPVSAALLDRMAGALHFGGTATFCIQATDAVGYTGSIMVLVGLHLFHVPPEKLLTFADGFVAVAGPMCALSLAGAAVHFGRASQC